MMRTSTFMFFSYPIFLFFHGFLIEPHLQEKLNGKVKSVIETTTLINKGETQTQTIYRYDEAGYLTEMDENPTTSLADKYSFEYADGILVNCTRLLNHVATEDEIQYYEYKYDEKQRLISYRYYGLPSLVGSGFEGKTTITYNDTFPSASVKTIFNTGTDNSDIHTPSMAYFNNGRIITEWTIRDEDTVHRYYIYNKQGSILISRTKTRYHDVYTCFDKDGRKLYGGPTNDTSIKHHYIYSNFDKKGNYRKMIRTEDGAIITRKIEYY